MKTCFIALILCLPFSLFSKPDDGFKYGSFSPEEIQMLACPFDSSAGAVNLADFGGVRFEMQGGYIYAVYTRKFRIKILDKKSLHLANYQISGLFSNTLIKKKAHTINFENGKAVETEVEWKDVFFDKLFENVYSLKIPFPNVKVGSVIEAELELHSSSLKFPTWYFQQDIPALKSVFKVSIPEYYSFRKNLAGYLSPANVEETMESGYSNYGFAFSCNNTTWTFLNVPAMVAEPYVSTIQNYRSRIDYELTSYRFPGRSEELLSTTWQEVAKNLYLSEMVGGQIQTPSGFLNDIYVTIPEKGIVSDSERIEKAYLAVQSKVKWNHEYTAYSYEGIKNAYKKGEANSADINLILLRLLHDLGYDVSAVALKVRHSGMLSFFPTLFDFNHLIVLLRLNGKPILLDASDKNYPCFLLPEACINDKGLVIRQNTLEWASLVPQGSKTITKSVEAKLLPDGTLSGKLSEQLKAYGAHDFRETINDDNDITEYLSDFSQKHHIDISKHQFQHLDQPSLPVQNTIEFTDNSSIVNNDNIFVQPMMLHPLQENPYKLSARNYPVEYPFPEEITYIFNLTLPDGYTIEEKPANASLALPLNAGRFTYQINITNNTIQLISKFSIKTTLYNTDQYPDIREFYSQVIQKANEQLVLVKK